MRGKYPRDHSEKEPLHPEPKGKVAVLSRGENFELIKLQQQLKQQHGIETVANSGEHSRSSGSTSDNRMITRSEGSTKLVRNNKNNARSTKNHIGSKNRNNLHEKEEWLHHGQLFETREEEGREEKRVLQNNDNDTEVSIPSVGLNTLHHKEKDRRKLPIAMNGETQTCIVRLSSYSVRDSPPLPCDDDQTSVCPSAETDENPNDIDCHEKNKHVPKTRRRSSEGNGKNFVNQNSNHKDCQNSDTSSTPDNRIKENTVKKHEKTKSHDILKEKKVARKANEQPAQAQSSVKESNVNKESKNKVQGNAKIETKKQAETKMPRSAEGNKLDDRSDSLSRGKVQEQHFVPENKSGNIIEKHSNGNEPKSHPDRNDSDGKSQKKKMRWNPFSFRRRGPNSSPKRPTTATSIPDRSESADKVHESNPRLHAGNDKPDVMKITDEEHHPRGLRARGHRRRNVRRPQNGREDIDHTRPQFGEEKEEPYFLYFDDETISTKPSMLFFLPHGRNYHGSGGDANNYDDIDVPYYSYHHHYHSRLAAQNNPYYGNLDDETISTKASVFYSTLPEPPRKMQVDMKVGGNKILEEEEEEEVTDDEANEEADQTDDDGDDEENETKCEEQDDEEDKEYDDPSESSSSGSSSSSSSMPTLAQKKHVAVLSTRNDVFELVQLDPIMKQQLLRLQKERPQPMVGAPPVRSKEPRNRKETEHSKCNPVKSSRLLLPSGGNQKNSAMSLSSYSRSSVSSSSLSHENKSTAYHGDDDKSASVQRPES